MDVFDRASELEQIHRDHAIEAHRYPPRRQNVDGNCSDCGFEVEPERLTADPCAQRCISCQEEHEYLQAAKARNGRL